MDDSNLPNNSFGSLCNIGSPLVLSKDVFFRDGILMPIISKAEVYSRLDIAKSNDTAMAAVVKLFLMLILLVII